MGHSSIPVDLLNPGQVFACMGFLEAAETLYGPAEGGFRWEAAHDTAVRFELTAEGGDVPVAGILEFVANAEVFAVAPSGWSPEKGPINHQVIIENGNCFPAQRPQATSLPIALKGDSGIEVHLGHWIDNSSRDAFKLYAGNDYRSAWNIACTQIQGRLGRKHKVEIPGVAHLWEQAKHELIADPLNVTVPMGGTFNLDARCAWDSIDTGYSPNTHKQKVTGSPIVELMGAWGLENTRPYRRDVRYYRYAVWATSLPPVLARPAFANAIDTFEHRIFSFMLGESGENKIVQYAEEE